MNIALLQVGELADIYFRLLSITCGDYRDPFSSVEKTGAPWRSVRDHGCEEDHIIPHTHPYVSIYCTCSTLLLSHATFLLRIYALVRRIMTASVKESGIVGFG